MGNIDSKDFSFLVSKNKNNIFNVLLLKSTDENSISEICMEKDFNVYTTNTTQSTNNLLNSKNNSKNKLFFQIIIINVDLNSENEIKSNFLDILRKIRSLNKKSFIIIFSQEASEDAKLRINCFDLECNMVTNCLNSLAEVLTKIKLIFESKSEKLSCPICHLSNLSEDALWLHLPLYHINLENESQNDLVKKCPLCNHTPKPNIQVHYRNFHGPVKRGEIASDFPKAPELYAFALVVVKRKSDKKYLLVQEFANSGYWLPGGRVDPQEKLGLAAIRETKEEAGIDIVLTGVLTVQFTQNDYARLRVIYFAEPIDESQMPKSVPDYESAGACYVDFNDLEELPLRASEPLIWINYVEQGGIIYPLTIFSDE